jgi:hypothetical protein
MLTYLYPYRSLSPVIIRVWSVLHNIAGEAGKKKKFPWCRPKDELTLIVFPQQVRSAYLVKILPFVVPKLLQCSQKQ